MSKILNPILKQDFELIRDKIKSILDDELASQALLQPLEEVLGAQVFVERFHPFNLEELPAVNVMFTSSSPNSESAFEKSMSHSYFIDCYTKGKSDATDDGDKKSLFDLQRLCGVVSEILRSSQYLTLDFPSGLIENKNVSGIKIAEQRDNQDASSVMMGRVTFDVRSVGFNESAVGIQVAESITQVKIDESENGHKFEV